MSHANPNEVSEDILTTDENYVCAAQPEQVAPSTRNAETQIARHIKCGYVLLGTSHGVMDEHLATFTSDEFTLTRKVERVTRFPVENISISSIRGFYGHKSLNEPYQQWVKTSPGVSSITATNQLIFLEYFDGSDACITKFICLHLDGFDELRKEAEKHQLRFEWP